MKSRIGKFKKDIQKGYQFDEGLYIRAFECKDLVNKANNFLKQGAYSYGPFSIFTRTTEYIEKRMWYSMIKFQETRNHAHLVDMINWIRFLWSLDTNSKAHYDDSHTEEFK